jgi:hypothetical protein
MPIEGVTELTRSPSGNERLQIGAPVRGGTECLDHEEVAGHATASDRVRGVLDRQVVVDDDRADLDVLGLSELRARRRSAGRAGSGMSTCSKATGRDAGRCTSIARWRSRNGPRAGLP